MFFNDDELIDKIHAVEQPICTLQDMSSKVAYGQRKRERERA